MNRINMLTSSLLLALSTPVLADQGGFMYFQNNADVTDNRNTTLSFDAVHEDCMDSISNDLRPDTRYYIETSSSGWCFFEDDSHFDIIVKNGHKVIAQYSFEMDSEDTLDYWVRSQDSSAHYLHGEFATAGLGFFGIFNSQDRMMVSATEKSAVQGWMGQIYNNIANTSLNDLMLPGTHDSATHDLGAAISPDINSSAWIAALNGVGVAQVGGAVISQLGKAQTYSIKEQLERGIRYLDIRLCEQLFNQVKACHGTYSHSNDVDRIMVEVKDFLNAPGNENEVVIVDVQSTDILDGSSFDIKAVVQSSVNDVLGGLAANKNSLSPNSAFKDFINLNQRAVVLMDNAYSDTVWPRGENICTEWPNSDDANVIWNKFEQQITARGTGTPESCADNKFLQSQLIATIQGINHDLSTLSLKNFNAPMKMDLLSRLHQAREQSWMKEKANIVIEDFSSGFDLALYAKSVNTLKTPQPIAANVPSGSFKLIRSMMVENKCLDTSGGANNGANIIVWDCGLQNNNQKWRMDKQGYIHPFNDASKCLNLRGNSTATGTAIEIAECSLQSPSQRWALHADNSIRPKMDTNKCLDTPAVGNGSKIHLWDCHGGYNQQWLLFSQMSNYFDAASHLCMDTSGSTRNGQNLHMWGCDSNNANQPWAMDVKGRIRPYSNPNKCIDPEGPSTANKTPLQNWDCIDDYDYHNWVRYNDGSIRSARDINQCFDLPYSTQGSYIHLWQCFGGLNQRWVW